MRQSADSAREGPRRPTSIALLGADEPLTRRAARLLADAGHAVTIVATAAHQRRLPVVAGARLVVARTADHIASVIDGHAVVCNLLSVVDAPRTAVTYPLAVAARRHRRMVLTAVAAALRTDPSMRLIQRSTAQMYADGGCTWIAEGFPVEPNEATTLAFEAERVAAHHRSQEGDAVTLRFAHLYGHDDPRTRQALALARRGWLPVDGIPSGYWPTVHLRDAARAVEAAISVLPGVYNIAEEDPLTKQQVSALLAHVVGRMELHPLWPSYRSEDRELLERSTRLSAAALKEASGWRATRHLLPGAPRIWGSTAVLGAMRALADRTATRAGPIRGLSTTD